jgi:hypothetical protein
MKQHTRDRLFRLLMAVIASAITVAPSQGFSGQSAEEEVFAWRLRAGISIPTQKVLSNVGNDTTVASLFNTDANYALKEWLRVGVLYEWHEHTINFNGPKFGNLTVNTFVTSVEFRVPRAKT